MSKGLPILAITSAILLASELAKSTKLSLDDDGKLTFSDAPNFVPVWPKIVAFAPVAKELPAQVKDIDAEELKQIKEIVVKELGEVIDDEKLILKINASLELVQAVIKAVEAFKA